MNSPPIRPKIYHIVHVDRLSSIVGDGHLWSDAEMVDRSNRGTSIGMPTIKQRRARKRLSSHDGLHIGGCVPFYFCPRSVMLYVIYRANHVELSYRGGETQIVHLEADLREVVEWADRTSRRWAFTLSNAGSRYFEERCDLAHLDAIDWQAIAARDWQRHKESKQAEFLVEKSFSWNLVRRVGVHSRPAYMRVVEAMRGAVHRPSVEILPNWYYGKGGRTQ